MTDFAVIYEQADDGSWSVSAVDLPVFVVGDTREEATREIRDAIALHLDVLSERGEPVPAVRNLTGSVSV